MTLYLPSDYTRNESAQFSRPVNALPTVYAMALKLVEEHDLLTFIDLACGRGQHLTPFYERGMWVLGFDYETAITELKAQYRNDVLAQVANLNNAIPFINQRFLQQSIIVCANAIEYMIKPLTLIKGLSAYLQISPYAIISTVDRDKALNTNAVQQWSAPEFIKLLNANGLKPAYFTHTDECNFTVVLKGTPL
jgi:2-polyprenyl-3-methyl-5-hydroxy-6-metoxy-1,4-benzoquinol methylase